MKASSRFPNRPDIDGLRAIAVLSVFLYHLEVPPFGGGFVGVDIFFVISGYLISRIVLTDVESGSFSMARFYERRIRRLAPAGIVTIVGTLLIGALWFSPGHFKALAQDVVATVGSVSNFYFWRGSHDYFAKAVDPSPVLHFWSLAVEEQFYLVWPASSCWGTGWLAKACPCSSLVSASPPSSARK
jgi:peptidoglycan/LPS O-acetylase OafA/YrhL